MCCKQSENEISRQFPDHDSKTVIIPDYFQTFQTFPDIHSIPDNLARRTNPDISDMCIKASRKLTALGRLSRLLPFAKRRLLTLLAPGFFGV